MTEAQFTYKLKKELTKLMPHAVVLKHADMFTKGVPDMSVTHDRRTTWIEIKLLKNVEHFEPIQLEMLRRMGGWYVIWDSAERRGWVFQAGEVPNSWRCYKPEENGANFEALCNLLCRIF